MHEDRQENVLCFLMGQAGHVWLQCCRLLVPVSISIDLVRVDFRHLQQLQWEEWSWRLRHWGGDGQPPGSMGTTACSAGTTTHHHHMQHTCIAQEERNELWCAWAEVSTVCVVTVPWRTTALQALPYWTTPIVAVCNVST